MCTIVPEDCKLYNISNISYKVFAFEFCVSMDDIISKAHIFLQLPFPCCCPV